MPPTAVDSSTQPSEKNLPSTDAVEFVDPSKVRVVDIESEETGEVFRRDCYDPNGSLEKKDLEHIEEIFQLVDGEVHVLVLDWARSRSPDSDIKCRWVSTGMDMDEIDKIRVFSWPDANLVRVFEQGS